ncbi:MAG: sigma-70 family RNA polymerase sigma factor [Leptolyngbya sp. RL_3_1]|nr:sigma-70 family RNA polymerase sigma factor [Leptolyngbya sp. RL_3_1]
MSSSLAPVAHPTADTPLVKRLWQGDLDAMGALYDRYSNLVYTIALRSLKDVASAEDLTQDVFLTLMNRRTYDPDRGSLSSYLSLLTRSRAIDRLRAQTTRHKYLHQWHHQPHAPEPGPMDHASQQERHTLVRAALDHLTQQQRQVLELSYYQGQSQVEIADQLGVPLGTVKSWARRGLLRLRSHLQGPLSEDPFSQEQP